MTRRSINERLPATVALVILLLFATVLTYWIVDYRSLPEDWRKAAHFSLTVKSCEQAEAKAEEDYKKGIVRMYFAGGFDEDMLSFPHTFYKKLEEEYNIEVILAGDLGFPYYKCYNLKVDKLLSEKIGEGTIRELFQKMHQEKYGKQP